MIKNMIFDLLKTSAKLEIKNKIEINDDCIEITLPNGEVASVIVKPLSDKPFCNADSANKSNDYVCKHNYGNIGEDRTNKLLLRNLQDVKDYVLDVVKVNLIDVAVCGDVVRVFDELALKISVEAKA